MEQRPAQPNWEHSLSRFYEYVKNNCAQEIIDPGDPDSSKPATTRPFMPLDRIKSYFERQNYSELRALLASLFPNHPVNPKTIFPKYIAVFCTLLFAGRGNYIKHFTRFDNLSDTALPFDPNNPPTNRPFTAGDPDFWSDFCKQQWRFCAPVFEDPISNKHFEDERILPIICKKRLAGGGSANLWLVKIYPFYNKIIPDNTKDNCLGGQYADTFVLKEYTTLDAQTYYDNETSAFNLIGSNSHIIGFYGSFTRNGTFNVLLEYADKGTLKEYLENQALVAPTNGEDITQLWEALFKLIHALKCIHMVDNPSAAGPQIFQGWHQDVKPENILVVSNGATYPHEWQFKLADLGISHFKRRRPPLREDSAASDTYGTKTYGAPETSRPDVISQQAKLNVKQNIDIWSLGCIYSEIIRWLAHQHVGVKEYRKERKLETEQFQAVGGIDCFHNGNKRLRAVHESHKKSIRDLHKGDCITEAVVGMVETMLDIPEGRPTADQLWRTQLRIVDDAKFKPSAGEYQGMPSPQSSPPNPYERNVSHPHPTGPSRRPTTSGPLPPKLPPKLPPEFVSQDHSQAGVFEQFHEREYDNTALTILDQEDGAQRHSPDLITIYGDGNSRLASSNQIQTPQGAPQNISQPASPSSHPPYFPSVAQLQSQHILESQRQPVGSSPYHGAQELPSRPRGSSPISETAGPRYHKSDSGTIQTEFGSQRGGAGYRDSLNQRVEVNGNSGYQTPSAPNNSFGNDMVSYPNSATYHHHHNESTSPSSVRSPVAPSPVNQQPLSDSFIGQQSTNNPRPRSTTHPTAADHMTVEDALDWKRRCKSTSTQAAGLNKDLQNRLKGRDHVFLIDDSVSMVEHWPKVCKVFEALSYILKETDKDGLDLYFTISQCCEKGIKQTSRLLQIIEAQKQRKQSTTDITIRLTTILDGYKSKLEKRSLFRGPPKPLSLYIFTNGIWEEEVTAEGPIRNTVQKLQDLRKDRQQIGIQFVSFGDDSVGLRRLRHLDYGLKLPEDIVDTEPWDGNVWKMLLGPISAGMDVRNQQNFISPAAAELARPSN